ncbi:MAG: hypothetical protein VX777_10140 [Chlamydiota bacterium]|nr:hypothetical protein [Chlamydiota bacterium]
MNPRNFLIFFITLLPLTYTHSDIDDDIFALEDIESPKKQPGPFRIEGEFDSVCETNINKSGFENQEVQFSQYSANAGMAFCYFPHAREAYAAAIDYNYSHICWAENPFFNQKDFNQGSLLLRLFSNRFCEWIWQGQLAIKINTDHWDFNQYANYDLTLWGKYDLNCDWNLHIGAIVQTGMKMDRIYPILGFDYEVNNRWKLNAVFPVNISMLYTYDCNWSGALAMRFFDIRHRVGKDEPLSMGLVAYRNSGVELVLLYEDDPTIEANIHIGSTLGGMLRISDKNNKHAKHFKLDPAMYVGAEAVWSF